MWLFYVAAYILRVFFRLINGKPIIIESPSYDKEKTYLIVAPHRSLLDPVMIAIGMLPKGARFIAKVDLFKLRIANWAFRNAGVIAINRENPNRNALKEAVKTLKHGKVNVAMFPTGSRYSDQLKPGAAMMASMAKVEILPVAYQGPIHFKHCFSWKKARRMKLGIGEPIALPDKKRLSEEDFTKIDQQILKAFEELDHKIDPNYFYDIESARREREQKQARKKKSIKSNE